MQQVSKAFLAMQKKREAQQGYTRLPVDRADSVVNEHVCCTYKAHIGWHICLSQQYSFCLQAAG